MPDTIDSLELKISADAGSAAKNIDGLASSLLKLSGNLDKVSVSKLKGISSVFTEISGSAIDLKNALNALDFNKLAGSKNALSKIIDKKTVDLMTQFGISGKNAFAEIRSGIAQLQSDSYKLDRAMKNATDFSNMEEPVKNMQKSNKQLVSSIKELYSVSTGLGSAKDAYKSLVEYINAVNRSGGKIHVPFSSEFGEDWSRMRSSLGRAFTATGGGTDFEVFITELNHSLGNIIDTTKGAEGAFTDLYEKLRLGRGIVDDYNKSVAQIDKEPLADFEVNQQVNSAIEDIKKYRADMATIGQDVSTGRENSELGNLRQAVTEVTNAVRSKTKAFQEEGRSVEAVVKTEISSLSSMLSMVNKINKSIGSMANSSTAFGGVGSVAGLKNLTNSIDGIKLLRNELTNLGNVQFDATGIQNIANSIAKLGRKNVSAAVSNIPRLTSSLRDLASTNVGINGLRIDETTIQNIERLASAIVRLGSKAAASAANGNIASLAQALKQMMSVLSTAPSVSKNIIRMAESLGQLASNGTRAGRAANSLSKNLRNYTNVTSGAENASRGLASVIGKLYASYFLLIRGASGIKNSIQSAMDLQETFNYFSVAMDKIGQEAASDWQQAGYDSAEAYADSFQQRSQELTQKLTGYTFDAEGNAQYIGGLNMGMNPNEVMQYQAMYAQMANSIGLAGETALNTSKALTMLGADWASLRNISTDDAWMKLASALAGETEAVRQLGLDVTEATMQQTAYKYGIDQTVGSMDRATKIQLTLLSVLDQSRVAWGDMAKTIESPANQFRVLSSNIANLARTIGSLFLPVIANVLPYINAFVIALQRLFSWLGNLMGVETGSFTESANTNLEGWADTADDVASGFDNASESAEKLKKTVLGFDELNQLNDQNTGASGGGGAGGLGGLGGGNPQLDAAISDLLDEYQKVWDEAFRNMSNRSEQLADEIVDSFVRIYNKIEPLRNALGNLWEAFKPFAQSVGRGLINFMSDFGELAISFGNNVVAKALDDISESLRGVRPETAEKFGYALGILATALSGYKTMTWISGIFGAGGVFAKGFKALSKHPYIAIATGIVAVVTALDKFGIIDVDWDDWTDALGDLWDVLRRFAKKVGGGLLDFLESVGKIATPILETSINALAEAIEFFANALDLIPDFALDIIGRGIGAIATAFLLFKGASGIATIISKIGGAFGGLLGAYGGVSLTTIASGTSTLVNSIGSFGAKAAAAGVINSLKGALSGLLGVIAKHPLSSMAVGILGIVSAMDAMVKSAADSSQIGQFADAIEEVAVQLEYKNQAVQEENDRINEYVNGAGLAEMEMARDLADEYYNLADKTNKSYLEKEQMRDISQRLAEVIPELNDYINEETGELNLQRDSLEQLIKTTEEYYKKQAAEDMLVDAYKNQLTAQQNLAQSQREYNDSMREYFTAAGLNADAIMELVGANGELDTTFRNTFENMDSYIRQQEYGVTTWGALKRAVEGANESYGYLRDEMSQAEVQIQNSNDTISFLNETIKNSSDTINSVNYAEFVSSTANAIDQAGGLWQVGLDGMTQITGEKALEIYKQIQEGVLPDNGQGYYDLGNGVSVAFGNGIAGGTPAAIQTLDNVFLAQLNSELISSGMQVGYNGGSYVAASFTDALAKAQSAIHSAAKTLGNDAGIGFSNGIAGVINVVQRTIETVFSMPSLQITGRNVNINGRSATIPQINYNWYANSGIVSGEIWGMNELGNPEMVGQVRRGSGKTAVANNAIISDAIEAAVERAMSRALMNNGQNDSNITLNTELIIDDETIARAVSRGQRKLNYRMKPAEGF